MNRQIYKRHLPRYLGSFAWSKGPVWSRTRFFWVCGSFWKPPKYWLCHIYVFCLYAAVKCNHLHLWGPTHLSCCDFRRQKLGGISCSFHRDSSPDERTWLSLRQVRPNGSRLRPLGSGLLRYHLWHAKFETCSMNLKCWFSACQVEHSRAESSKRSFTLWIWSRHFGQTKMSRRRLWSRHQLGRIGSQFFASWRVATQLGIDFELAPKGLDFWIKSQKNSKPN